MWALLVAVYPFTLECVGTGNKKSFLTGVIGSVPMASVLKSKRMRWYADCKGDSVMALNMFLCTVGMDSRVRRRSRANIQNYHHSKSYQRHVLPIAHDMSVFLAGH